MKRIGKALLLTLIFYVATVPPALAYIDPNTGGMLFQMLAVAFASLSAILLFFSRQIRTFVARVLRTVRGGGESQPRAAEDDAPTPEDRV